MNLEPFKDLLVNLSRISHWDFEVMDPTGVIFSSGSNGKEISNELQYLSTQIMSQAAMQKVTLAGCHTLLGVPLEGTHEVLGSLIAHDSYSRKKSRQKDKPYKRIPQPEEILALIGHLSCLMKAHWADSNECETLTEQICQSYEEIHLYSKITPQIKTLGLSSSVIMLEELVNDILKTMRIELAFTLLPGHPEYNFIVNKAASTCEIIDLKNFVDTLISIVSGEISQSDYRIVHDSRTLSVFSNLCPAPYRFLIVKIQHEKIFYGWLGLVSFNMKEYFRRSELKLLTSITEQLAVIMTNANLYRDLEYFAINVVKSLVHAIEAKDSYTRGHSEQVNRLTSLIAERFGFNEHEKNALHWASLLHDVGKIGIPEEILNKPGRLTDEEYNIIKTHPEQGCMILKPLAHLPQFGSLKDVISIGYG